MNIGPSSHHPNSQFSQPFQLKVKKQKKGTPKRERKKLNSKQTAQIFQFQQIIERKSRQLALTKIIKDCLYCRTEMAIRPKPKFSNLPIVNVSKTEKREKIEEGKEKEEEEQEEAESKVNLPKFPKIIKKSSILLADFSECTSLSESIRIEEKSEKKLKKRKKKIPLIDYDVVL